MTGLSEYRSKSAALLRIVTCAVIVLALLACDNGQPGTLTDNGEVMLTLRISLPTATDGSTATRAITSNEENAIDIAQLKVLVFKANSSTETFSYEAPQIQLQDEKYIVTLKQSLTGKKYRLVVIANAGKKLPVIPDNTAKNDVLKMITFDATGMWNATGTTNYSRFPMWGETTATQAITPATSLGNITLLRSLARIDVGCMLNGETAAGISGFTLKTVSVYRTKNKGYAAPVNGGTITDNVVASVSIPPDAGTNDALTYTCTDGKSLIRTIYVAETPQGNGRDNNVCLVVGGTYAGSTHYYKVDLTSRGSYIPLKRNCRYIVNIKAVNNAGYTTEAAALTGDKTLVIATSISAEAWSGQTSAGSGTITMPQSPDQW